MGGDIVPENVDTTVFNAKKRWRRLQELVRHVWLQVFIKLHAYQNLNNSILISGVASPTI